jgi:citrate lyase beta subunit
VSGRLDPDRISDLLADVEAADAARLRAWPGPPAVRQPVQVLYVPADRVVDGTPDALGEEAAHLLARHLPDPDLLPSVMAVPDGTPVEEVHRRVARKLRAEPIEDLRVDFEDGYLGHDDAEEDADATRTGAVVGRALAAGTAPPWIGLRVRSFADGTARRSVTTLDRFLGALLEATGARPDGIPAERLRITFPKILAPAHVAAFADVLTALEAAHGLPHASLGVEAQVETTASVLGPDGRVALRDIRDAAAGRLRAVHFGVFDYTAAIGLPAEQQRLDHPACDLARHLMQVTFAGTEVQLADGSTNVRPADGSTAAVHEVWRAHSRHVAHSLAHGFAQGWDLHPAHLVSRYATVYAHLLAGIGDVLERLAAWTAGAVGGGVVDEPATVLVLRRRVAQALGCGALDAGAVPPAVLADIVTPPGRAPGR